MGQDADAGVWRSLFCRRTQRSDLVPGGPARAAMIARAILSALAAVSVWAQIPAGRIVNADREPGNWLTYSRTYSGHRYTPLAEITAANVAQLRAAWTYQIEDPG